jgi:hypothetical protein
VSKGLTVASNRSAPQLADPGGQYALEVAQQQREPVVVASGEVADVQRDPGERLDPRGGIGGVVLLVLTWDVDAGNAGDPVFG